ncbi:MAG: hypothetical protein HKL99_00685 [Burkholderiales bacterium]|nr:hypothetical protein [Burkholderiales bacterium]
MGQFANAGLTDAFTAIHRQAKSARVAGLVAVMLCSWLMVEISSKRP